MKMHRHLLVLAIISTCICMYSVQGDFENCCLSYAKANNYAALGKHIKSYYHQEISESCHMRAVVFYLKKRNRIICANPHEEWVIGLMKQVDRRQFVKFNNFNEKYKAKNYG
ncbi:C-C motif chemokine 25-like [Bombina bombina]|uniref:C-C motif chemokine 25-like n=1 Tax=Bombina bombina TaxID=8345 RepID=UPI00235A69C4|nr:C-C motif chemokine 25-like [Bombina bombina]